jgi:hypothetical protein
MSSVKEIEQAIRQLPQQDLAEFRQWFAEFDAAEWDREIGEDVAAGRFDALANEALDDLRSDRSKQL